MRYTCFADPDGKVVRVSPDAFVDEAKGISYYRAELVLDEGEMSKLPEGAKLLPGMPVEAFLRTHDRTALAYLLKPFTDYFAKAFRETCAPRPTRGEPRDEPESR